MEEIPQNDQFQYDPKPVSDGRPYFMGDNALIKFSGGEGDFGSDVYWLADNSNNTIRPFESPMALDTVFGDGLQEALKKTVTVASPIIDSNNDITEGVLTDFNILGPKYLIKEDGTSEPLEFSSYQLKGRYGKNIDENRELEAERTVDSILNSIPKDESDIDQGFINKLRKDRQLMAFYISALAYGNFQPNYIHADIIKRFNSKK